MDVKKYKVVLFIFALLVANFLWQRSINASQVDTEIAELDTRIEETSTESKSENNTEKNTIVENTQITITTEVTTQENITIEDTEEKISKDIQDIVDDISNKEKSDNVDYYYYLNKYAYSCKEKYLEKYVEFLLKKKDVNRKLLQLGEITDLDFKLSEVELSSAQASLTEAQNEKNYYTAYMSENGKTFEVEIEAEKEIYDYEYYKENYPEKDKMEMLRYLTDYNNKLAYINAKKVEKGYVEDSIKQKKSLFQKGEISEIEVLEEEILLEKVQYELTGYYVELNLTFCEFEQYLIN